MRVLSGTLVAVNDHRNHQNSVYVKQTPERQSVQEGHSVSLHCSLLSQHKETREQCPGEHDVYWLRAGVEESHPAVIYTSETTRVKSAGRSCIYSLSKTIHNSSDAGTYYCAVATCGQILFGEGTTVDTKKEQQLFFIVLGTLLLYSLFVTAALILYRNQRTVCKQCKGEKIASSQEDHHRTAEDQPDTESPQFNRSEQWMDSHSDGEEASLNYVALDFAARKAQRFTSIRESPLDCTYSSVGKRL
ncbi:uncharacterized protein LOC121516053 isoform X2 [Cheilinus undulatus]|nr:uncharacterized protein LOC121516053 isoform X2 [Cheilinus undulatus]